MCTQNDYWNFPLVCILYRQLWLMFILVTFFLSLLLNLFSSNFPKLKSSFFSFP